MKLEQLRDQVEKEFKGQFMQSYVYKGKIAEIEEKTTGYSCLPEEHYSPDNYEENHTVEFKEGFLSRLSANGYLDCTNWSPSDTEEEALQNLLDMYGQD